MLSSIFVEGLIYALMVLGVFITFRILDFPDLTVDGSFATGACVAGVLIMNGYDMNSVLIMSFVAGVAAGVFTALLHTVLKIPNLLAGIITMTILYSINIRILLNKSYLSLTDYKNEGSMIVYSASSAILSFLSKLGITFSDHIASTVGMFIFFLVFVMFIKLLIDIFFRTDLGISIGALGSNEQMILSQGVNPNTLKVIGVGLSNGLVALSGALYAQFIGNANAQSGVGIIVIGLAAVMLGEFIIRSNKIWLITFGVIFGSIIYKGIVFIAIKYGYVVGFGTNDLKLITGLLIILIIMMGKMKKNKKSPAISAKYSRILENNKDKFQFLQKVPNSIWVVLFNVLLIAEVLYLIAEIYTAYILGMPKDVVNSSEFLMYYSNIRLPLLILAVINLAILIFMGKTAAKNYISYINGKISSMVDIFINKTYIFCFLFIYVITLVLTFKMMVGYGAKDSSSIYVFNIGFYYWCLYLISPVLMALTIKKDLREKLFGKIKNKTINNIMDSFFSKSLLILCIIVPVYLFIFTWLYSNITYFINIENNMAVAAFYGVIFVLVLASPFIIYKVINRKNKGANKRKDALSAKENMESSGKNILVLENVNKKFFEGTPDEKHVLRNLSLTIDKGDFITIIGSNGAGKSTLFNVISGTYDVTDGKVLYKNKNITKMKEYIKAQFIGRIFQNPLLGTSGDMALEDNMILCRSKGFKLPVISLNKKIRKEFAEHVSRLNMGLEDRLADNVGLFSGGQRQALTLLMTAMSHPELVLLDEHTAALDPDNSNRVMELTLKLREEYGLTMMMITHNMQHAIKYGNRLIMMDNGEIILDISEEEKKNLTVEALMEKFKAIRKDEITDEKLLLTR